MKGTVCIRRSIGLLVASLSLARGGAAVFALPTRAFHPNPLPLHTHRHRCGPGPRPLPPPRQTPGRTLRTRTSSRLRARPQDNLVAGLSEISLGFSLGVLWSELSIVVTGCGPINFSDTLERLCYQGTIVAAGAALFHRIVSGGKGLDDGAVETFGELEELTLVQVRAAEYASGVAVLGAFVALAFQYGRGTNMDGLSGIDVDLCRALRDL